MWLVAANGLSRASLSLPLIYGMNEDNLEQKISQGFYFSLNGGRLFFERHDGVAASMTSCIPNINQIKKGMGYGLKTLDEERKRMDIIAAKLDYS